MLPSCSSNKNIKLNPALVIGLMSGTSMDGVDVALVRISPKNENNVISKQLPELKIEMIDSLLYPLPEGLCSRLHALVETQKTSLPEICQLNFELGHLFAEAALALIAQSGCNSEAIDLIGSHGQTLFHIPGSSKENINLIQSTLQIGEPSIIAERTGITTVADFRPKDIAAGGEGAPLVCFADFVLFADNKTSKIIQNIGGIANATVIFKDKDAFAFDSGPGNILINLAVRKYFDKEFDEDAKIALSGVVDESWISKVIHDEPYFHLSPPKTTGRELFNINYLETILSKYPLIEPVDIVANLTALTAKTISDAYSRFVFSKQIIDTIILGGGGAYNPFIVYSLQKYLDNRVDIKKHEDYGISNKFKEAIAFAILAYTSYYGICNNVPSCTGAKKQVILGKIIPS